MSLIGELFRIRKSVLEGNLELMDFILGSSNAQVEYLSKEVIKATVERDHGPGSWSELSDLALQYEGYESDMAGSKAESLVGGKVPVTMMHDGIMAEHGFAMGVLAGVSIGLDGKPTMYLTKKLVGSPQEVEIVSHELVHVYQQKMGWMAMDGLDVTWLGVLHKGGDVVNDASGIEVANMDGYLTSPWEAQAYALTASWETVHSMPNHVIEAWVQALKDMDVLMANAA